MTQSKHRTFVLVSIILLAVLGIIDAVYLTAKAAGGGPVVCNVLEGCNVVLNSSWASFGGIPTALYGLGYYGMLLFLAVSLILWPDQLLFYALAIVSVLGLLVSTGLVYLQFGVIGAVCEYCLLSAGITLLIFGLMSYLFCMDRSILQ